MTSAGALARLRDALESAGYTEDAVRDLVGRTAALVDRDLVAARLDTGALATLVKLFGLGVAVPRKEAEHALAPAEPDELADLLAPQGDALRASVGLTAHDGLFFLHDPQDPAAVGREFVTGVNSASKTLASLTVRRPATLVLDVGTGSGVQALLAARHSERVVATDVSERALHFAGLNARLNGVENVEFRPGSFFGPARSERFDLVVSNPPYVISPDSAFVYRDGGRPADEVSREVVGTAPGHLVEGGFATILANWVVHDRDDPWAPLESWVEGRGCDAWLLHYATQDAVEYAARWNEQLQGAGGDYSDTVGRWIAYYGEAGIDSIAMGAVLLRRRSGTNWVRRETVPLPPNGTASDQIVRVFEAEDAALSDHELLGARLALVEPHRLDQSLLYGDGAYSAQEAVLVLEEGVGARAPVDPHAIHVLFSLDGTRVLRELVDEVVETTGLDRDVVAEQTLATARRLYELGFAVRAA